jgi:hypothetical protein
VKDAPPSFRPSSFDLRILTIMSIFALIDDKHVPLYRILWVSELPHYCGSEECEREGWYEVKLDHGEAVWASQDERDNVLQAIEAWQGGKNS